jgi:hypothetical protein
MIKARESHRNLVDIYWAAQLEASRLGHRVPVGPTPAPGSPGDAVELG